MLRLRHTIERGLRHPLVGPVLLVFLGLLLVFVVFHAVEHGALGDVLVCVAMAAFGLRLLLLGGPALFAQRQLGVAPERAPPIVQTGVHGVTPALSPAFSSPLRR